MTNPYASPAPAPTDAQLEYVRSGQKLLIYAILFNIVVAIAAGAVPMLGVLQLLVLGVSLFGLFRLFQGMRIAIWIRILLFLSMVVPLLNLIVLLALNHRATKALRRGGYRVGLFGAGARDAR